MVTEREFREAVERYRDTVFRVAFAYMRSAADADDVTQDVFFKLLRAKRDFESDDHVRNWLVRVTVNACKSLFRSPWRRVDDIERYTETLGAPGNGGGEVLAALMRLPERYRVPLVLYHFAGYSTGEIAEIIRAPAATVRTRLARGRSKLKVLLGE